MNHPYEKKEKNAMSTIRSPVGWTRVEAVGAREAAPRPSWPVFGGGGRDHSKEKERDGAYGAFLATDHGSATSGLLQRLRNLAKWLEIDHEIAPFGAAETE